MSVAAPSKIDPGTASVGGIPLGHGAGNARGGAGTASAGNGSLGHDARIAAIGAGPVGCDAGIAVVGAGPAEGGAGTASASTGSLGRNAGVAAIGAGFVPGGAGPVGRDAGIAVIGAGPAGCAAAITLARAGRRVLLLERTAEARESVCGEFLGPDAAAALALLGLDLPALGGAPLRRLRVAARGRDAAVALPFAAWGLPRRSLDGALREAALAAGVEFRCASVSGAEAHGAAWRLRLADGGEVRAGLVVLATGKHALRGHARRGAPPGSLGLKLHLHGVAPGFETVLLPFEGGYAGLQPLPGGDGANLSAALHGSPGEAARDPGALLARVAAGSALGERLLGGLRPAWARPLAVGGVPYGFRHRDDADGSDTLYRVGDQATVIPSFTGSGVAVALHSGLAAAAAILDGAGSRRFHADWRRRTVGPMRWAGATAWMLRAVPYLTAAGAATGPSALRLFARRTRVARPGHA